MKEDEKWMTAEEFFGTDKSEKGADRATGMRQKKRRENKTFADIKARMVMRIYRVTRAKADKIVSKRAAVDQDRNAGICFSDDDELLMTADEFFRD